MILPHDATHQSRDDSREALRARLEQLELVLRATNEGLWDTNLLTYEVYYSPRWKEMLGYADDEIGTSMNEWRDRIHPEDLPDAWSSVNAHLRGETPTCEFEHRVRHKDGSYRWIYERAIAQRDESGRAIRLIGSHADITDRKRAEEELAGRNAILEAVRYAGERFLTPGASWQERVHDVLAYLGRATGVSRTYVYENRTGEDGELWSTLIDEWTAPGIAPWIDHAMYRDVPLKRLGMGRWVETLGHGELMYGHVRDLPPSERPPSDGTTTLSFVSVPIFVDGAWWGAIGFDECVQEREFSAPERDALKAAAGTLGAAIGRKRADDASDRLAAIVETTNDAIFGMTRNGTVTSWNAAAERLYGYTEAEMVGRRIHRMVPGDAVRRLREVLMAMTAGEPATETEVEVLRRDQTRVWVSLTFSMIRDAAGEVIGTSAIGRDISARKRAEQDLRQRDQILEAVRFAAERFLDAGSGWEETVQDVLERLGRATGVCQVYVAQNRFDADGEVWITNLHEWRASAGSPPVGSSYPGGMPLRATGLANLAERFGRGEIAHGHSRDFPAAARSHAEAQGVVSWVIVPIHVEGSWWGLIGFDECVREREFSVPERDALKAAADTLGAAIGREMAEERNAWLAAIVESSDDAIVGRTLDNRIVSWNEGAERLYGYRADEVVGKDIDVLLPPEEREPMQRIFEAIRRGEHVDHYETERLHRNGERLMVSISFSPVRNHAGEVIGSAAASRDISARKRAEAELRESQRSLRTLLANLPGMAYRSRYAHDREMEFVSEGALGLTGHRPADLVDNARLAYADLIHPEDRQTVWEAVRDGVERDQPFQVTYRIRTAGGEEKWVMEQGRAVLAGSDEPPAIEGIVTDVTDRAQARLQLEQRVEERTRELATLLSVSTGIASTLELRPLLGRILDQFGEVVEHVAAAIYLLDGETDRRLLDYRGPAARSRLRPVRSLEQARHSREVVSTRQPVIIPDIWAATTLAESFREEASEDLGTVPDYARSWMGVPLIFREQVIGLLTVVGGEVNGYTDRDAGIAFAFASQAAVAIVNARLYEQAQGTAALEERQRLARELHDSVSQALFGIGLGARTARTLLDEHPEQAAAPLDYVLSLAEAGLTEMRALIFELRPEALEQEGLVAALEKQVANIRARHGITVEADLGDPGAASLAVAEAIYRIVQEALNNTVKHARATRVTITLSREPGRLVAEIADNGAGFDARASFSGHLGLHTMRERAERLGGSLEIESTPGAGTRLRTAIPV